MGDFLRAAFLLISRICSSGDSISKAHNTTSYSRENARRLATTATTNDRLLFFSFRSPLKFSYSHIHAALKHVYRRRECVGKLEIINLSGL